MAQYLICPVHALRPQREMEDMSNLSLALFWCMIICILNYCPTVHGLMLKRGKQSDVHLIYVVCESRHKQEGGGKYLMPRGSGVPEDGSYKDGSDKECSFVT